MEIDLKQLRELMRSLKQFDIAELEIEKDGERIFLRRGADGVVAPMMAPMVPSMAPMTMPSIAPAAAPQSGAPAAEDPNVVAVKSPFVGTFYRSPSPDAGPFVDVGSEIRKGQVLCIVEAMKLMNEIESELAGTIVEVAVENGKPVEYGQVLFRVKKS